MELLLFGILLGTVAGMIAGVLPGLGITSTLILSYPFIKSFDPVTILCFYMALACSVQYFGSVVGIYLGVPGETTALVSSKVGFNLMIKGQGNACLGSTAIASLFAAIIAAITLYFLLPNSLWLLPLLSAKVQAVVLSGILVTLVFYGSNNLITNISMIVLGVFLSTVGYNPAGISVTFGTDILIPGLNSALVLLMIFVIPNLLKYWNTEITTSSTKIDFSPIKSMFWVVKRWASIVRGTVIGLFAGLIPGIGPIISSNLAAQIEQRFNKKPSAELLSSEAANNAAIITCFIPFFALGLTLMAHEAVVNDLLINQNTLINAKWLSGERLNIIILSLIAVNILAFLIAWPASRSLVLIYKLTSYRNLVYIVLLIVGSLLFYQSTEDLRIDLDLLTVAALVPITIIATIKRLDTLPLMFAFLIGDSCIKTLILVKNIL